MIESSIDYFCIFIKKLLNHFWVILFVSSLGASIVRAEVITFDHYILGTLQSPWMSGVTGKGKFLWTIDKDVTAPSPPQVLRQSAEGTFPWIVKQDVSLRDGFVQVKFKAVSGKEDQVGGVIWRFKGGDYYIARANALEDNVTIYHTTQGKRRSFKSMDLKVSPHTWHTLRVEFKGKSFQIFFDGKGFSADDETLKDAGAVGLWTKADSVTVFDDFTFGGF